ncbi:DNA topoisomerase, partial [Streptococcus gordonii]|uniref:DNA topoisomerase n=1 Tax=Streptococcus gordonii TaxID=1302 RepID=UPI001D063B71
GSEDTDPDAERKGLGTPATRAAVIEKLVKGGFVERKGKQLLPTKDGINLVCVLTSGALHSREQRRFVVRFWRCCVMLRYL